MYASVRRYRVEPEAVDEVLRLVDTEIVEELGRMPSFISFHTIDSGNGILTSISVFGEESDALEWNVIAADFVRERLAGLGVERTEAYGGAIVVHRAGSASVATIDD